MFLQELLKQKKPYASPLRAHRRYLEITTFQARNLEATVHSRPLLDVSTSKGEGTACTISDTVRRLSLWKRTAGCSCPVAWDVAMNTVPVDAMELPEIVPSSFNSYPFS